MQSCCGCQESLDFVCTACETFFCKECTSKHEGEDCYLDKPKTYFSRLLAVKRENIEGHFENCNNMDRQLLILKEALNKQEVDIYQKEIKKDIENIESYCRKVEEAEEKLECYEEELKKEIPIVEMFEKIKRLEDTFNVPKFDDDTIEILLVQNAYIEPDKKNDKGERLKQTERQLQICLGNQINNFINKIQESAIKHADDAKRSKQDMNNLEVHYKQMKQKYADEEAELKKGISEGHKAQKELEKKNKELIQENEKLLEDNEKLKEEKEKYEDEIKSKEQAKKEITEEIENQQSKLNSITAELEKESKINEELEKKNSKQTLNLRNITEKLAIREKYIDEKEEELNRLDKELNEIKIKVEVQTHNLKQLNEEFSERKEIVDNLIRKEKDTKDKILEIEEKKDPVQEYDRLKIHLEDIGKVKEDYTKEKNKLEEENLELKRQRRQLESELEDWKQKYAKESEEHVKVKSEIEALHNQKSDLESKVKNHNEEFMELNKKAIQSYKQKMKKKVNRQKKKREELQAQYKELDGKYESQSSELDNLKSELSYIIQDNKNLVANIEAAKEEYKKEKQVLSNLIEDLKGKISKRDHTLYCIFEDIKKYMEEAKNSLKEKINRFAKRIKKVTKKVRRQAKKASKVFGELRKLCKNTISNMDYISNEKSSSQVKIDSDNSDINQIYINLKEIIQRMNNAYSNIKTEKETEIERLKNEVLNCNYSVDAYKQSIENMKEIIENKEGGFMQRTNSSSWIKISSEEVKKENTRVTEVEDDLRKHLEHSENNKSNLAQKYNTSQQEKSKLMENIKTLENDFKNLKDQNERIKRELKDLDTKIRSLEDNKLPIAEHKENVPHEENKAKESKGICNIQLIDDMYSHEIFRTGAPKNVTKENVYEKKSINLVSEICCFCLKEEAIMKAVCLYHSRCHTCRNKAKGDCKLCKLFGFKPLDFACDNCKSIVSLSDVNILISIYKNCNSCMKTGTSNTSKVTRYKLPVRVL